MATIINSVAFENFYNYYGSYKQNEYKFKPGINIVNADNNMGKSKFYNGFMWILRDQVYDSDIKAFTDANESLMKMASGKAKAEDDSFKVGVRIIFTNNNIIYTIEKYARFTNKNGELIHTSSILDIFKNKNNGDSPVYDKAEIEEIINNIFIPLTLRNYALLQGESMDRLVDLSSKKALSDTIDTLAGISVLKGVCDFSHKLSRKADELFQFKESENSKNDSEKQNDLSERGRLIDLIEREERDRDTQREELGAAELKKEALDAFISNSSKREEIRSRYVAKSLEIKNKEEDIVKIESSITKKVFDEESPWLLMGLSAELDTFDKKREKHIGDVSQMNNDGALVIMLPEGSPDTSSLERMLNNEICEVCGRPAHRNSDEWNHIKLILERPKKKNITRNDFGQFYGFLQRSASSYSISIPKVDEKIESVREQLDDARACLEDLKFKENEILIELNNAGGNADNSETKDKETISDYGVLNQSITKLEKAIKEKTKNIGIWNTSLEKVNKRLENYKKDTTTEKYEKFAKLMNNVDEIFRQTKDDIFDKTVSALAKEANEKYIALTAGNQSSGGRLNFERNHDVVNVSIRDVKNGEITGLGTGFQRMKQLAIVMAVISSKIGEEKRFDYPFISDAPFSEFGENFINNFFKVAPGVFSQSIILIKELYDPNGEEYLTAFGHRILKEMREEKIPGTFYVNIIKERADTTDLVTTSKCLKY